MRVRSNLPVVTAFLLATLVLSGCFGLGGQPTPTQVTDLEYTQAAETIAAELTQMAPQVSSTLQAEALASPTLPPTSTPEPTETLPPTSTPEPTETPLPTETPTPDFTATPTFTPEPAWELVFQDDMVRGFWNTEKTDTFRMQYSNGGYMLTNKAPKDIIFSVRDEMFANVRVEVTGRRIAGPVDGFYGIICHFANGGNYYLLGVGVDGWYGIGLRRTGKIVYLQEGYDKTGAVRMAGVENQLRAECGTGKLTLWANGIQLASVQDPTFTAGMVGLGVGNRDTTGTEIVFNDFMVYQSEQP